MDNRSRDFSGLISGKLGNEKWRQKAWTALSSRWKLWNAAAWVADPGSPEGDCYFLFICFQMREICTWSWTTEKMTGDRQKLKVRNMGEGQNRSRCYIIHKWEEDFLLPETEVKGNEEEDKRLRVYLLIASQVEDQAICWVSCAAGKSKSESGRCAIGTDFDGGRAWPGFHRRLSFQWFPFVVTWPLMGRVKRWVIGMF